MKYLTAKEARDHTMKKHGRLINLIYKFIGAEGVTQYLKKTIDRVTINKGLPSQVDLYGIKS